MYTRIWRYNKFGKYFNVNLELINYNTLAEKSNLKSCKPTTICLELQEKMHQHTLIANI
jgi:hypothetical protein